MPRAGNRMFDRVTQAVEPGPRPVVHENDRSWRHGYDDLQRLTLDATMNARRSGL